MMDDQQNTYRLASADVKAPTSFSYWVVPGLLLGGAYPGAQQPEEHRSKVQALVSAGVRTFINLMEEAETNLAGEPFVPYADVAREFCSDTDCHRFPIRDLSVPSRDEMEMILAAIDESLSTKRPAYIHCWGGVGRTGTTIGCWLLRHKLADPTNVLDVLMELRQQDRERRHRVSPETTEQRRFVTQWLAGDVL